MKTSSHWRWRSGNLPNNSEQESFALLRKLDGGAELPLRRKTLSASFLQSIGEELRTPGRGFNSRRAHPSFMPPRRRTTQTTAQRWARRLTAQVQRVLAAHPEADPDNVRHTLILLELPPLERLQRSLIRARTTAILRK
jgi:hypothetical protein